MFSLQKINDKFQALEFYEYQVSNYSNDDIIGTKFCSLSNFLKPKNKFNYTLIFDGKPFIISNKELFMEHLINILPLSEKYLLYTIFLKSKNHFITSRPNLLNIFKNNIEFTKYSIYKCLELYMSVYSMISSFEKIETNWGDYVIERIKEDSEYNERAFKMCLTNLNNCFNDYKLVINFKYLFENNTFTKNFWKVYQFLIFHPHILNDSINLSRLLTLTNDYQYGVKTSDCIFRYLNEYLNELNINNIRELFDSRFISFILNNTIDGKIISNSNNTYDMNFNQFVNYCRKNLINNI